MMLGTALHLGHLPFMSVSEPAVKSQRKPSPTAWSATCANKMAAPQESGQGLTSQRQIASGGLDSADSALQLESEVAW